MGRHRNLCGWSIHNTQNELHTLVFLMKKTISYVEGPGRLKGESGPTRPPTGLPPFRPPVTDFPPRAGLKGVVVGK